MKSLMCGIIGYMGPKPVVPVLLEGLQKLEYRGYDSAGLALVQGGLVSIRRTSGKLVNLARSLESHPLNGQYGIGHMRWATHGLPSEENAHPHRDCTGRIVIVHNGIIENYLELKSDLQKTGHNFTSETDSEIIAHLVEAHMPGRPLEEAVASALTRLRGSFAICLISSDAPNTIIAARNGPPLILGLGEEEWLLASEIPALLQHTQRVHFLRDGEMAVVSAAGVRLLDSNGRSCPLLPQEILWSPRMVEKAGYRHFMLKEINEQPRAVHDTILGRMSLESDEVFLEEARLSDPFITDLERIHLVACGTSWHAALFGKFILEEMARTPVDVDYSSEFLYRGPILNEQSLVVAISQSGETSDTLAAVEQARAGKARILSVCNVVEARCHARATGRFILAAARKSGRRRPRRSLASWWHYSSSRSSLRQSAEE
jgi:glucosamine--fructose-6-phosphate aminotransferase (isomerizing)